MNNPTRQQLHEIFRHVGKGWSRKEAAEMARACNLNTQAAVIESNLPFLCFGVALYLTAKKRVYPPTHLPAIACELRTQRIPDPALLAARQVNVYTVYKRMRLLCEVGWEMILRARGDVPGINLYHQLRTNRGVWVPSPQEATALGIQEDYPPEFLAALNKEAAAGYLTTCQSPAPA